VTVDSFADLRSLPDEAYGTYHAGCGGDQAAALVHLRDIRPLLRPPVAAVVDIGSCRGELVRLIQADDPDAEGIFGGRVPNAVRPPEEHVGDGDFTHRTSFTARSIHHLAAAAGFHAVLGRSWPLAGHRVASAARVIWQLASACRRITLAVGTSMLRSRIRHPELAGSKGMALVNPAERSLG
jgi:hypothetical protein